MKIVKRMPKEGCFFTITEDHELIRFRWFNGRLQGRFRDTCFVKDPACFVVHSTINSPYCNLTQN